MNILPKKSWHVRTKANIEKVRRDEAKALQDQLEKAKRADLAAQERRIRELRNRSTANKVSAPQHSVELSKTDDDVGVRLFDDCHDSRGNREREREKRKEQEEYEKKIGLLTYLGGSQVNAEAPWYMKDVEPKERSSNLAKSHRDELRLQSLDPLNDMTRFLRPPKQSKEMVSSFLIELKASLFV